MNTTQQLEKSRRAPKKTFFSQERNKINYDDIDDTKGMKGTELSSNANTTKKNIVKGNEENPLHNIQSKEPTPDQPKTSYNYDDNQTNKDTKEKMRGTELDSNANELKSGIDENPMNDIKPTKPSVKSIEKPNLGLDHYKPPIVDDYTPNITSDDFINQNHFKNTAPLDLHSMRDNSTILNSTDNYTDNTRTPAQNKMTTTLDDVKNNLSKTSDNISKKISSTTDNLSNTLNKVKSTAGDVADKIGSAGNYVKSNLKTIGEYGLDAGKTIGAALPGMDNLYDDIRDHKIDGNNWEQKGSNLLGIAGAGLSFIPGVGELVGGIADAGAAGLGAVGDWVDDKNKDKKEQTAESKQVSVSQNPQSTSDVGGYSSSAVAQNNITNNAGSF